MYDKKVSWDQFEPHALPVYKLWHPKDTPAKSIIQDYICLDTETSRGIPDPDLNDMDLYMDNELLNYVKGLNINVHDSIKKNTDWKHISKIFRKLKIKNKLSGFKIHELYDQFSYMLDDAIEESDQLNALIWEIEKEINREEKQKNQHIHPIGWIYQWCFSYPCRNGDRWLVYGRKPSQLAYCMEKIKEVNKLDENNKILIFCHNLSYDYTYFHGFLQDQFSEPGELLAVGSHRIITYTIAGLEFRDSLKVSQKSLYKWGKDLGVKHPKLIDLIDYGQTRYQDSELYKNDWRYMFRDVITLDECIAKQLDIWQDFTKNMPLTSTGYIRRETRKEFKKHKANKDYFRKKALNLELYRYCKTEAAGGLTHGNRFYAEHTVDIEEIRRKLGRKDISIRHRDFVSHYPSQQITKYCPGSQFALYYDCEQDEKRKILHVDDLLNLDKCILVSIQIWGLKLRDGITIPYAQECKLQAGEKEKLDLVCDNGRVLEMLSGSSVVVLNEHDLKWYKKLYTFKYKIIKVFTASRAPFPKYLTNTVRKYFIKKTELKSVVKQVKKEHGDNSIEYIAAKINEQISKGMLNGIFGMTMTDPVRVKYFECDDGRWDKEVLSGEEIEKRLNKYYSGKKNFNNYELGCWTTSHARDELMDFAELIGWGYILYTDTDSLFYISTPEIEEKIEARNKQFRDEDDINGWYIEVNGKRVYFNQFDDENEDIIQFRFLHAKCYAYVTSDGELHATIAGVPERHGDTTRVSELGSIHELTPGKVFKECGGTITKYPPKGETVKPRIETVNGHDLEVSSYALIENSTKELKCSIVREEQPFFWEVLDYYD